MCVCFKLCEIDQNYIILFVAYKGPHNADCKQRFWLQMEGNQTLRLLLSVFQFVLPFVRQWRLCNLEMDFHEIWYAAVSMECDEVFQFCWNVAINTNTLPVHLDHNPLKRFLCKSYRFINSQTQEGARQNYPPSTSLDVLSNYRPNTSLDVLSILRILVLMSCQIILRILVLMSCRIILPSTSLDVLSNTAKCCEILLF